MVPSWRLEALHCICATGYHEISLTLRARAQRQRPNCVPLNLSEAHPPVRQPLISFQSRCLKRAYPVCFARGKRSSEGNADEDGNPKAKNDSGADSSTDSPSSSSFGGGSNWNNWGFGFGIGKSDKSDLAEEERERKIRQEEWERWQRSWSESENEDSAWSEDLTSEEANQIRYPRQVDPIRGLPRDAYLRPMIDARGIRQRLAFKSQVGEDELRSEFGANQEESRRAITFSATLLGVPLLAGFCISRLLAEPVFHVYEHFTPNAFAISDRQKLEGAEMVHKEELRLQMDVAIGRHPPLTDDQLQGRLRKEARHLRDEFKEENKKSLLNILSDSVTVSLIFILLAISPRSRRNLSQTIGRVFGGLSDTAKAFLIIASTDILLGYHSEEGWTAAIHLFLGHYGTEPDESLSHLFVATIPVVLDSIFKYWIFVGLNRKDPAATVTLKSMDRH